ncbi:hypothetical protein AAG906_006792 [Vitis piasezkii]
MIKLQNGKKVFWDIGKWEGGSDKGGRGAEQANGCSHCSSDQGGESLVGFRAAGGGGSDPAERWLDHQDNGRRPKGIFLGTRNSNINLKGIVSTSTSNSSFSKEELRKAEELMTKAVVEFHKKLRGLNVVAHDASAIEEYPYSEEQGLCFHMVCNC